MPSVVTKPRSRSTTFVLDLAPDSGGDVDAAAITAGYAARGRVIGDDATKSELPHLESLPPIAEAVPKIRQWCADWLDGVARLPAATGLSHYRGVSIWDATCLSLISAFFPPLYAAWCALRILRDERPEELVVVTDARGPRALGRACLFVCDRLGVPTRLERCVNRSGRPPNLREALTRAGRRGRDGLSRRLDPLQLLLLSTQGFPAKRKRRILFADFFAHNVGALLPIHEEVCKTPGVEVAWLALRPAVGAALRRVGVQAVELDRVAGRQCVGEIRRRAREVELAIGSLEQHPSFRSLFQFEGLHLEPFLWSHVRDTARVSNLAAARMVRVGEAALQAADPDVVVTGNDATLSCRAFVLTANKMGIPTAYIQHGMLPKDLEVAAGASDRSLIWGESSRRRFLALGKAPDQLIEVGATQYDALFRSDSSIGEPSSVGLALDAARKVLVYTSAPASRGETQADYVRACTAIHRAAGALPNVQFVVKLHPSEDATLWNTLRRRRAGGRLWVIQQCETTALLARADIVLTRFSTTGIEAAILGKPLVMLNLTSWPDRAPYAEAGIAVAVRAPCDLVPAIRRVLSDPETRRQLQVARARFLNDTFIVRDGFAGRRAAEAILSMCNVKAPPRGGVLTQPRTEPPSQGEIL